MADRSASIHAHGLVRVAAATPRGSVGDPVANADAILAMARRADDRAVDLVVFPELGLTSYAIDDLHQQDALLDAVEGQVGRLIAASEALRPVLLVGAGLRRGGRLYNCALAIARGRLLGVVPKSYLPNYREYYEKRWFAAGAGLEGLDIVVAGHAAPFGPDLLFAADELAGFVFHAEVCEDYWAPIPPSSYGALAGATILCNLSASNITVGKERARTLHGASQSARAIAAYVYAAAGPGESTTDLAWDGQAMIHEMGRALAVSDRFAAEGELVVADVDVGAILQERMRVGTFEDCAAQHGRPETRFRRVGFAHRPDYADVGLLRAVARFPFVPDDPERLDADCYEAFNIQVEGLARRVTAARARCLVIGISGGLDSTHALIVAARACDRLGLPRSTIRGYTMPGFATGEATLANAWALMRAIGCAAEELDIRPAARQMLADIGHPFARGEPDYDVTFENVQAGLRTDYLFRLANRHGGLVVGTGDLSEMALGWCTYGVGDQMSHYAVNAGVPKTLIQFLIRWCVRDRQFTGEAARVLDAILATEISPELVPAGADGAMQSTEERIGPYALHDFFLHHVLRHGAAPDKIAFLAHHAWGDAARGAWPAGLPDAQRRAYDRATIDRWLRAFLHRFFETSQFKRSASPNGPKVSASGSLSPRGDWRAPSDGTARPWLDRLGAE